MHALATLLLFATLAAPNSRPSSSATKPDLPRHDLAVVTIRDAASLARLMSLDLDLAASYAIRLPVREVHVIAAEADLAKLRESGLPFRIEVHDLEGHAERQYVRRQRPMTLTPPIGHGGMGGHYTWAEVNQILDEFAKKHPAICTKKVSLGKSHENRDIWMVKISDNVQVDEAEPEVLFDSLQHAREPMSLTTTLFFMDWLLDNYRKDPQATFLVDHREMFFVPCMNPDGYEYNRSLRPNGGGGWRKNRRNNGNSYGVDLNRNWPTGWSAPNGGNSTSPDSYLYRGPSPLSEPETTALDNFIKSRSFVLGCSLHCYQEILLYPYAYKGGGPKNNSEYVQLSEYITQRTPLPFGAVADVLYVAAGGAIDHYHEVHGMHAFTPELGTAIEGGFWPAVQYQDDIALRHRPMLRSMAELAGPHPVFDSVVTREGTGSNQNKILDPGENGLVDITLNNPGASGTTGKVVVSIRSSDPRVSVVRGTWDLGPVAKFSKTQKSAALEFQLAANATGPWAKLQLEVSFDGAKRTQDLFVPMRARQRIVADDFETDLGFENSPEQSSKDRGRFERGAPVQTVLGTRTAQPGADHSPTGTQCWVTGAQAGANAWMYQVTAGHTSFVSPELDLRHVALPQLSFWLYYTESRGDDPFRFELSDDGGKTWKLRYSRFDDTKGWEQIEIPNLPRTEHVRFRFWAQDLLVSVVEALIDDLEVTGFAEPGDLTFFGSGARGTTLRWNLHGDAGASSLVLAGVRGTSLRIPGIAGSLELDLNTLVPLSATSFGNADHVALDLPVPDDTGLLGFPLAGQQLLFANGSFRLGNVQERRIR